MMLNIQLAARPVPRPDFGVYIHWPFCSRICPYCDFNVHLQKGADAALLAAAIITDLSAQRRISGARPVRSVSFGGGSPSLMPIGALNQIIGAIDGLWGLAAGAEISLEVNPADIQRETFRGLARAGVNRLSIGAQALNDADLRYLGRSHNVAQVYQSLDAAADLFDSISMDLIYCRPRQSLKDWEKELAGATLLGLPHLSLYELTIEEGTAFGRRNARGTLPPALDDPADFFLETRAITASAGYSAYETSNFARAAKHESRHNKLYWHAQDWAAAGPGAHARFTIDGVRFAGATICDPAAYVQAAQSSSTFDDCDALTPTQAANEALLMGLRLNTGIDLAYVQFLAERPMDRQAILDLVADGHLIWTAASLRVSQDSAALVDRIASALAYEEPESPRAANNNRRRIGGATSAGWNNGPGLDLNSTPLTF